MEQREIPRRTVLKTGAAAGLSGLAVLKLAGPAQAFPGHGGEGVLVPWIDPTPPVPPELADILSHPLKWEELDSWLTPNDEFFTVKHYNQPVISPVDWRLNVAGLVANEQTLSLADLKALPKHAVTFALECSGNTGGAPFGIGLIGNARWAGASLRQVLRQARPLEKGVEVIFWGTDRGQVTIRDNSGVTGPAVPGEKEPDGTGSFDLTITEQFARSMSLEDAMAGDKLLCYEMNGVPLPPDHGAPMRLIAPDWYGVANVKWLTRIEITDARYQGRFMARDYVSIREEQRGGDTVWTFTSVTHELLKSAPAKVTRQGDKYSVMGAAWGAPIAKVQVRVDSGRWRTAKLRRHRSRGASSGHRHESAWSFWTFDLGTPTPGLHAITSRAFDEDGNVQPKPDDPRLTSRHTFWENNGQITRRVLIP
jgi:DMSO/TMAO reductase YedYZ molybdopterin-dependent catalytic subunit